MNASAFRSDQLLVLLSVNGRRHALPARFVVEVLPWLPVQPVPLAPAQIKGMLMYRGQWIPVIDLASLLDGAECPRWMASRTVIFGVGPPPQRLIGLRVEACELLRASKRGGQPGLHLPEAPFLGEVLSDGDRLIQLLKPDDLLDSATLEVLAGVAPRAMAAAAAEPNAQPFTP